MWKRWAQAIRGWAHEGRLPGAPRIGLALGGGFSRCLAHIGVLQALEEQKIPIYAIAGLSSGAIIAAAYASGATVEEMMATGAGMSFSTYARWTLSRMGLASSEPMDPWLRKCLRQTRFEEMKLPVAVVATDVISGSPVVFKERGDIIAPVRATCAYPGLFRPVQIDGRWLVDGGISLSVPVDAVKQLGATHVISVYLRTVAPEGLPPTNALQIVTQCFSILQDRVPTEARGESHVLLEPRVASFGWNAFERVNELVEAGREAVLEALPAIQSWLKPGPSAVEADAKTQKTPAAKKGLRPLGDVA